MLNVSAKEFVPAASVAAAAPAAARPKPNGEDGAAQLSPAKAQLSPKAPEFVPRAVAAACGLDAASDPPRSVLDPPRSDSTLSSSVVSREADGGWVYGGEGYGEADGDDNPERTAAVEGYYGYGGGEEAFEGCDGYGAAPLAQGGELLPEEVYDTYNYGMYDGYVMPYNDGITCPTDSLGATVYYDTGYDAAAVGTYESYQTRASYYWDESTGTYVQYGDAQYDEWQQQQQQQYDVSASDPQGFLLHPDASTAFWGAGPAAAQSDPTAQSELSLEAGLAEAAAADGTGAGVVGEEQLRSLARGDAAELLEMFFPHYAGEALSRLLDRTGGDMLAAFAELAAMERQVGAERAAAASSGGGGGGRGRGGGGRGTGGRSSPGVKAGGQGKRAGGGAAAFKLDLESFPSLPPSASPQPAKPAAQATTTTTTTTTAAEADDAPPSATADSTSASAAAPAAAASPAKPNFAALLRSAAGSSSDPPVASSSASADASLRPSQAAPQRQAEAEAEQASSSSGVCGTIRAGGAAAAGRATRAAPAASSGAAVPWVSTGEAVAAQYAEERAEAAMLARARNMYFQQATLAYLSGNKALAKQLGRKGREMNEAMKAAHAAAARRIFAQRNAAHQHAGQSRRHGRQSAAGPGRGPQQPSQSQSQSPGGEGQQPQSQRRQQRQGPSRPSGPARSGEAMFVDLHGLHAAEAVTLLEAQIEEARAAGCRYLRVCTGTGHHTKGAKTPARLPSAVADTLLANHLTFKTLKPGLLEAQL